MTTRDFGYEAQQAAEKHLEACWEAFYDEEESGAESAWPEGMAAPFCGCMTCVVRETLHAAWPIIEESVVA